VKLQQEHAELQREYASLKATSNGEEDKFATNEQVDQSLAAGLLKLTKSVYGRQIFRFVLVMYFILWSVDYRFGVSTVQCVGKEQIFIFKSSFMSIHRL